MKNLNICSKVSTMRCSSLYFLWVWSARFFGYQLNCQTFILKIHYKVGNNSTDDQFVTKCGKWLQPIFSCVLLFSPCKILKYIQRVDKPCVLPPYHHCSFYSTLFFCCCLCIIKLWVKVNSKMHSPSTIVSSSAFCQPVYHCIVDADSGRKSSTLLSRYVW